MNNWIALIVALVLNAAANILLKIGAVTPASQNAGSGFLAGVLSFVNAATAIGICLFAANVLVYRKAIEKLDISVAYPVMVSGGLLLVTLAAVFIPILNEKISLVQLAGMVLIAIGVWLVAA